MLKTLINAFTHTQNALIKLWRRYQTKFHHHSGSTGHNSLPLIFAGKAVKLEKVVPTFSSFIPFPSLPFVSNRRRGKFQCLNIVLNNKIGPLFLESC